MGFGTRKALMPLCFLLLSVVAKTTQASDSYPLVIHALVPLSFQLLPELIAVVEAAPASLPFPVYLTIEHNYNTQLYNLLQSFLLSPLRNFTFIPHTWFTQCKATNTVTIHKRLDKFVLLIRGPKIVNWTKV